MLLLLGGTLHTLTGTGRAVKVRFLVLFRALWCWQNGGLHKNKAHGEVACAATARTQVDQLQNCTMDLTFLRDLQWRACLHGRLRHPHMSTHNEPHLQSCDYHCENAFLW